MDVNSISVLLLGKSGHRVFHAQKGKPLAESDSNNTLSPHQQIKTSISLEKCAEVFTAHTVLPQRSRSVHIIKRKYFMLIIPTCLLCIYLGS